MLNTIGFLIGVIVCIFLVMVIAIMIGFAILAIMAMYGLASNKPNIGTRIFNYDDDEVRKGE